MYVAKMQKLYKLKAFSIVSTLYDNIENIYVPFAVNVAVSDVFRISFL